MLKTLLKTKLEKNVCNIWNICIKRYRYDMPTIIMNNGNEMPIIGFGTWGATSDFTILESVGIQQNTDKHEVKTNAELVAKAVRLAINAGYRHIDCAHLYKNEKEIGKVLKKKFQDNEVKRENMFITSKLWNTHHNPEKVCSACQQTLTDLQLEYLDMYLMHSPMGFEHSDDLFPLCNGKLLISEDDYICTWRAMENLVEKNLCKNIGISNFNIQQMERLLENCKIIPQTLQIEVHPYLTQKELIKFAKSKDICVTAYSPLGSPKRPWAKPEEQTNLLTDYTILQLAKKHKRSPAQILLRYQIQCGHAAIPKATDKHIVENFDILDFELCPVDIKNIESLNFNKRFFTFKGATGHPHHPFETCQSK